VVDILPITSGSTLPRIAWDSVLDDATLTSDNVTEVNGDVAQAADWLVWSFWRPIGAGPYVIEAELDCEQTVNAWAIAGHDADGLIGMDTWDGADWITFAEVVADGTSKVIYLTGDAIATTKLRFRFTTISFLSTLWAGQDLVLPEGVGPGWSDPVMALRADVTPEVSREGIWIGASIEQWKATLTLDVKHIEAEWARDYWTPFLRVCSTRPFFLHWNNVDWPDSACLCTNNRFGNTEFTGKGIVSVSVTFDADPGMTRNIKPDDDAAALLT
jgi:hypothetical protein